MSKRRMRLSVGVMGAALACAGFAQGAVIGKDGFDYADGSIGGQVGGSGWVNEFTDEAGAPPSAPSNWNVVFGSADVIGGKLVTNNSGGLREYNGLGEGSTEPSNEREGALRAVGKVYYGARMTRGVGADWGGMSGYDFGTERLFFGVPGQGSPKFFGIDESGVGVTLSGVPAVDGQEYFIVAMLDFETDQLAMWIDPAAGDEASPDVVRAYTNTNWNTSVRLASGGTAATTWDDLTVATTFAEAVPEPTALGLIGLAGAALLRRRK